MNYFTIKTVEALPEMLNKFFDEKSGASILEIETDPRANQHFFDIFISKSRELWKKRLSEDA